jgi:phage terminase small subunit
MAGVPGQRSGGRNAKATVDHKARGTWRRGRHGNHETPEPPRGRPTPPKPLTGDARSEWDRMVARLESARTLCVVDDAALYQYACLFADVEQLMADDRDVRQLGARLTERIDDLDGADLVSAISEIARLQALSARYAASVRQGRLALRAYLVEFGMTPAARPRVKLPAASSTENRLLTMVRGAKG